MIAQSLVDDLKATKAKGGILQVNGSPTDAAAGLIKKGIHSAVDPSGYKLLAEYDTPGWAPAEGTGLGGRRRSPGSANQIAGVVAANDGTGGATIAAFKAAGTETVPPVTGNDAELAALQRIVAGDQYNTISKPIKIVAEARPPPSRIEFAQGKQTGRQDDAVRHPVGAVHADRGDPGEHRRDAASSPAFAVKIADVCTADVQGGLHEAGLS